MSPKVAKPSPSSDLERSFLFFLKAEGLPIPETEYRFHPERKWRWDVAWPNQKLAVELEGGLYVHGRHSRGQGYEKDMEKHNAGAVLGWTLLRFSARMVESGEAIETLKKVLSYICERCGGAIHLGEVDAHMLKWHGVLKEEKRAGSE